MTEKENVLNTVRIKVLELASEAKMAMDAAQEAANSEGKSSMGDKYETGRAMAQLDRDMYATRYHQIMQDLALLDRIEKAPASGQVRPGSLVGTSLGKILIAVSLGVIGSGSEKVLAVSAQSPLGKSLLGKAAGDSFAFQGKGYIVDSVC